jgi:glyoxylase-like metal-dependent hydrolase (beta-lactamase superfamily II)
VKPMSRNTLGIYLVFAALLLVAPVSMNVRADKASTEAEKIKAALAEGPGADYRIQAIQTGYTKTARRNLFIADASLPRRIAVSFSFWVISGGGRVILVDTGFTNRAMISKWNIEQYKDPAVGLAAAGFQKEQVTDVIITHTHWDHTGGLFYFPNATVHISKRAMPDLKKTGGGRFANALRKAKKNGRLHLIKKLQQIAPKIATVPCGLHAPGFQYVVVENRDAVWVLASDVAPLYANFKRKKVTGQTNDPARTLVVQDTILELVGGNLSRIVPGHEPEIFKRNQKTVVDLTALDRENSPLAR